MLELPENVSIKAVYLHDSMYGDIPSIHILFYYQGKDYPVVISCIVFDDALLVTSQKIQCYDVIIYDKNRIYKNNGYLIFFESELVRKGYTKVDSVSAIENPQIIFKPYNVKEIQEKIFSIFEEPSFE